MRVLLLGPERPHLKKFIEEGGDEVWSTSSPIHCADAIRDFDFIVSYGYKHILGAEIVETFWRRAINLHISLLPWNRGADPNLWSFLEDTPKGVTIHYIDFGIDTGDIIVQKRVSYLPDDTLRTSYNRLALEVENLFMQHWSDIRTGNIIATPQPKGQGSYHRSSDKEKYKHLLTLGWDTPVRGLIGTALLV